jgi:hypothetical protein
MRWTIDRHRQCRTSLQDGSVDGSSAHTSSRRPVASGPERPGKLHRPGKSSLRFSTCFSKATMSRAIWSAARVPTTSIAFGSGSLRPVAALHRRHRPGDCVEAPTPAPAAGGTAKASPHISPAVIPKLRSKDVVSGFSRTSEVRLKADATSLDRWSAARPGPRVNARPETPAIRSTCRRGRIRPCTHPEESRRNSGCGTLWRRVPGTTRRARAR